LENNAIDKQLFRRACGQFPTGVTVTTVLGRDGAPYGITVSSFTSVSLTPPLVLVCVDHRSHLIEHFQDGCSFGINVLCERQQDMSQRFSRNGPDRFESVSWYPGSTGVPLLPGVLANFECRLVDRRAAGDHLILIGEVLHAAYNEGYPLAYFRSSYRSVMSQLHDQSMTDPVDAPLDSSPLSRQASSAS
jgi:flavin reductase (DIM6/NTAB) family NADH-FMN oxidoreductase RutF